MVESYWHRKAPRRGAAGELWVRFLLKGVSSDVQRGERLRSCPAHSREGLGLEPDPLFAVDFVRLRAGLSGLCGLLF